MRCPMSFDQLWVVALLLLSRPAVVILARRLPHLVVALVALRGASPQQRPAILRELRLTSSRSLE
jgi:hypothetical protein